MACFAGPSFHECGTPLDVVVWAEAGTVNIGRDKAGSNANVESSVRRSTAESGIFSVIFSLSRELANGASGPSTKLMGSDHFDYAKRQDDRGDPSGSSAGKLRTTSCL